MNVAELGFTEEEIRERVIDRCVDRVLQGVAYDEDGEPYDTASSIYRKVKEEAFGRIDDAVDEIASKQFAPALTEKIETLVLQKTNEWGEKKGEPVSFIEYLTERAEQYFREDVDSQGLTHAECRRKGRSFNKVGVRAAVLVDRHMSAAISVAMENAMRTANESLADGLAKAAKESLHEITRKLKVSVKS